MHSKDLKRWQIERMLRRINPVLSYVSRASERAEETFPPDDQLRKKAMEAQAAM